MTTQNAKLLEKRGCIVYHSNREGRDSFTPRKSRRPEAEMNSATTIIVNCKTPCNSPSPSGRDLEGGRKLAEFTLTLTLSHRGRGILYEVVRKTINVPGQ